MCSHQGKPQFFRGGFFDSSTGGLAITPAVPCPRLLWKLGVRFRNLYLRLSGSVTFWGHYSIDASLEALNFMSNNIAEIVYINCI
ncbi:hypothetical protein BofuT4_uP104680.1 [Botrytis cinerea T4]|uniref:Uncharacterized protein n=1 Tax=Botryotinia fuckeliana (strain T4) TaxID=999810 RepID=G2YA84_BOTF4|nr:hypothetical protein BofuT4_uP104680.1 [Botrytis cinerea T4]